jgi:hypothetical protein
MALPKIAAEAEVGLFAGTELDPLCISSTNYMFPSTSYTFQYLCATSASKGLLQGDRGSQVSVRIRNLSRTRLGVKAMKKATKTMPSGLRANEIEILSRVKKRAYRLDVCLFNRCGIRFGWGAAVGIIPV